MQMQESARLQERIDSIEKHRDAALEECNRIQQGHTAALDDAESTIVDLQTDKAQLKDEVALLKAQRDRLEDEVSDIHLRYSREVDSHAASKEELSESLVHISSLKCELDSQKKYLDDESNRHWNRWR